MPRLLKSAELREKYLYSTDAVVSLIDRWRHQTDPQWRHTELTDQEKQAVWVHLSDTVLKVARKHFGQNQVHGFQRSGRSREWYEIDTDHKYCSLHIERIHMLADLLTDTMRDKTVQYVLFVYHRRFAIIEAERELRAAGVDVTEQVRVKHWVECSDVTREAYRRYGSEDIDAVLKIKRDDPKWTEKREENFLKRYSQYLRVRSVVQSSSLTGVSPSTPYEAPSNGIKLRPGLKLCLLQRMWAYVRYLLDTGTNSPG